MKVSFKSLMAASAFLMVGASHATVTAVPAGGTYNGMALTGSQSYTASKALVAFVNVLKTATIGNVAPTDVTVTTKVNAVNNVVSFVSIGSKSPLGSFDIDTGTSQLQAASGLGGLSVTASSPNISTLGNGFLSLSDLKVDLANKRVYATITGGNGVGTQTNIPLWDATTVVGSTVIAPPQSGNVVTSVQLSGLMFTAAARDLIAKSLNLTEAGLMPLSAVSDAGTIDMVVEGVPQLTTCTATYSTTRVRNSALYDNKITLRNLTGNPATGWNMSWSYDEVTLLLGVKNAKVTQKQYKSYQAQPVSTNTAIAADGSTTVTFRSISQGQQVPTIKGLSATLADQNCAVSAQ